MDDQTLLKELEALAERLGIALRYGQIGIEELHRRGGLCRVQGKPYLVIHARLPVREKVQLLVEVLRGFAVEDLYLKPAVRERLAPGGRGASGEAAPPAQGPPAPGRRR